MHFNQVMPERFKTSYFHPPMLTTGWLLFALLTAACQADTTTTVTPTTTQAGSFTLAASNWSTNAASNNYRSLLGNVFADDLDHCARVHHDLHQHTDQHMVETAHESAGGRKKRRSAET